MMKKTKIILPSFNDAAYCEQVVDLGPPASLRANDPYAVSQASNSISINAQTPGSVVPAGHAEDDTMVQVRPSRYVDYLSHDWKEEDVWSSWKYIVSKGEVYNNSARLENAAWRAWTKSKYRLKTVRPEALYWLKDCDVTWLYGPLQTLSGELSAPSTSIAKLGSSFNKKPILKKRTVLETMLQLSLPASSLPSLAAAAVGAQRGNATPPSQKSDTASMGRVASGYITSPFSWRPVRRDDGNEFLSVSSSGEQSPLTNERKHIHFNNEVEQWIAVTIDSDDDEDGRETYTIGGDSDGDDSSPDDEFLMTKGPSGSKVPNRSNQSTPQTSFGPESSTIAILPSTTLKYLEDAPELNEPTKGQGSRRISLPLSQETSEISKILPDNQYKMVELSWKPSSAFGKHKDSISASHDTLQLNTSWQMNGGEAQSDLRRTRFRQVVDAVNATKDIAYAIWNVGW